jgi:hypothetical protein
MTRHHRRYVWIAACVLLLCVGAGVFWLRHAAREGVVSSVNYHRIEPGMTAARVEQLFGSPGEALSVEWDGRDGVTRVYLGGGRYPIVYTPGAGREEGKDWRTWRREDTCFVIVFDEAGVVVETLEVHGRPPNFQHRLASLWPW